MGPNNWTIKDLLRVSTEYLKNKHFPSPRLDAELLLAHQLKLDRVSLYLRYDQPLNESEVSGFRSLIRRRLKHEPLQYITGVQEFWSLDFMVNPYVLIPRPESEVLVEEAIALIRGGFLPQNSGPKILDLGCGSGALAVSLATELSDVKIWATDISEEALGLARQNADRHEVLERIQFRRGNLWQALTEEDGLFDIIVSNPPYVAIEEYDDLPPEVRDYEPRHALDGRDKGLFYIEKIIREGPDYLEPGGWIILEMSPSQIEWSFGLFEQIGIYSALKRIKDYSHSYRMLAAQKA
jgi:release factor glutamine methyltransferase